MSNVITFSPKQFKDEKSNLEDMYESITEDAFPFVTLNVVDRGANVIISNTIAWARFRDDDTRSDLIVVQSSDDYPNTPTQIVYLSRKILKNYILVKSEDKIHYVFQYTL